MDVSTEHIEYALEPIKYLSKPQVGGELFDAAVRLCREKKFEESVQFCRELYQLGLRLSDTYVQGVADFCLGSVYFALGEPDGNWDHAADHYNQSARLFHTFFNKGCERNEGIAELALGRLYEKQCTESGRNKWNDAIIAFEKSRKLFCDENDPLIEIAQECLHRVTQGFEQSLGRQSQLPPAPIPMPIPQSAQPAGSGQSSALPQSTKREEDKSTMSAKPPRGPHGNYAIKVVCEKEDPSRSFPKPSAKFLAILTLLVVGVVEVVVDLRLLEDQVSKIIVVVMFFVTVLTALVLVVYWSAVVQISPGKIGIIKAGARFLQVRGLGWMWPLLDTIYDIVPTSPLEYKCRVEFREREGAAPVLYQKLAIRYIVVPEQLEQVVANQLSDQNGDSKSKSPLLSYWEDQLCDGIQRYFEDLQPTETNQQIESRTDLQNGMMRALQLRAINEGWGISLSEIHLGHYHAER